MKNFLKEFIIIYGAHLVALECYRDLCSSGYGDRVVGFAVSDMSDNPSELAGMPVKRIKDYTQYAGKSTVIIAMPKRNHGVVGKIAIEYGFADIRYIGLEKMSAEKGERLIREFGHMLPFELSKNRNDPSWLDADADGPAGEIRCKYPTLFYLDDRSLIPASYELYDRFECELEGIREIRHDGLDLYKKNGSTTMKIYMVFGEKEIDFVKSSSFDPWIKPIQISSHNATSKYGDCFDGDHEGNLSDKNGFLAEMTGAHWIWKMAHDSDYKGLCHYRRHFDLTSEDIAGIRADDTDVILTTPRFVPCGIRGMFTAETPVKEPVIKSMLTAIESLSGKDRMGFEKYLDHSFYFPNNMVVAKTKIYDRYCEWIFPILLRMLEIDLETGYGHENDRHIAYASELLTSYFFLSRKNEYKIVYTDYRFIE